MNAEIISVGTELLMGSTVNTDATGVSQKLNELGINVYRHTVVGDNVERLLGAVDLAKERSDLILTTGGLGPTCDDLTKQTLATAFGLKLVHDPEVERRLREYFKRFEREMPENNLQQAYLPEGCTVFYNTAGTAPGCGFTAGGVTVVMLPGPPRECMAMMEKSAMPFLEKFCDSKILSHTINIFGRGESDVEFVLRDYMNSLNNPTLAPYAKTGEVQLRVTAKAKNADEAEAMMAPVIENVKSALGDVIYGIDAGSMEKRVVTLLSEQGKTLSCAESCTGGLIAKRITDIEGASKVFAGGAVVYTDRVKTKLLEVSQQLIEDCGVISAKVAAALAENVREKLGTDLGVGVTGLAGPEGDGKNSVGTVFVALAAEEKTYIRSLSLGDASGRDRIRVTAANHALDMVRRFLTGADVEAIDVK